MARDGTANEVLAGWPAEASLPLIGRRLELDVVVEAIKGARSGRSTAVLLRGEAGVGKSRLLAEALRQADLLGCRALTARVDELDGGLPYSALRDALGPALEAEHEPALRSAVSELQSALLLALPGTTQLLTHREALQVAVASGERVLRAWADRQPLVLAVDDLHACDTDTLAVLSVLIRHLRGSRCVFVGALRDDAGSRPGELTALVERLGAVGAATVVELRPLDIDESRSLAASVLGGPPDETLAQLIWEKCRGNALLLKETLRSMLDAGALVEDLGRFRIAGEPPVVTLSPRSALLHRVFDLGKPARDLIRTLTLFPRPDLERLDVMADLAGLSMSEAAAAFDRLLEANLLSHRTGTRYEFTHPVVRDTLYDDLGPAERRRLHAAFVERLQRDKAAGADVMLSELATHVAASAGPGTPGAVELLVQAGDQVAATAPGTAAEWFGKALSLLPPDDARRATLLAHRARALALASRFDESTEAACQAMPLVAPGPDRQRLVIRAVSNLIALGLYQAALTMADESINESAQLGQPPHPRLVERRAAVLLIIDQIDEAERAARDALAAAADDVVTRTLALGTLAAIAFNRGRMQVCMALFDEQHALAETLPGTHLTALVTRSVYLTMAGHVREGRAAAAKARRVAAEAGSAAYQGILDTGDVLVGWLLGDWDTALENAGRARVTLATSGQRYTIGVVAGVEAEILVERGRFHDAHRVLASIGDDTLGSSLLAWARAGVELGLEDLVAARHTIAAALDRDRASGRVTMLHLLLDRLVDIETRAGQLRAAQLAAAELHDVSALIGSPWVSILAERAQGRTRDDPAALRRAAALACNEDLPFEAAVTRLELGVRGDGDALRSALVEFERLGAVPWRRRALAEMRARGIRVPASPRSKDQPLSETQRVMARLVHDGHTNRQIANILCLSPKTVEAYLTKLYDRTGCASRLDLALAVESGRVRLDP